MSLLGHRMRLASNKKSFVPVEFVGSTTQAGNDLSIDLTDISGLAEGDTVIVAFFSDNRDFTVTSSGWSGMNGNSLTSSTTESCVSLICYKVMGSVLDTDITISGAVGGADCIIATAFRNLGTPPSNFTVQSTDAGDTDFDVPLITVAQALSTSMLIAMLDDDPATIVTTPSGYTLADQVSDNSGSLAVFYRLNLPVGNEPASLGSWSETDANHMMGFLIPPPN